MKTKSLVVLLLTSCVSDPGSFGIGGIWEGSEIVLVEDAYHWTVIIESHPAEPEGPFEGRQHMYNDSIAAHQRPLVGSYYHPDVLLDFEIDLPARLFVCQYRAKVDERLERMNGRLSCLLGDTEVVDQLVILGSASYS